MMLGVLLAALCLAAAEARSNAVYRCSSPKYWCLNEQTAEECQAVEYCIHQWDAQKNKPSKPDAKPIVVALYYESLCPGCRLFLTSQMYPTYQKLRSSGILQIELIPYGNAQESHEGGKYKFRCQHGPQECVGNVIETCAIHILNRTEVYFPFIYCMESTHPSEQGARSLLPCFLGRMGTILDVWMVPDNQILLNTCWMCAEKHDIEYDPIAKCADGTEGMSLENEMAQRTNALDPPHQYVPWITVDGVHNEDIQTRVQTDMLNYVCETYKGTKPAACQRPIPSRCTKYW